jgi:hypothetical protein
MKHYGAMGGMGSPRSFGGIDEFGKDGESYRVRLSDELVSGFKILPQIIYDNRRAKQFANLANSPLADNIFPPGNANIDCPGKRGRFR